MYKVHNLLYPQTVSGLGVPCVSELRMGIFSDRQKLSIDGIFSDRQELAIDGIFSDRARTVKGVKEKAALFKDSRTPGSAGCVMSP